MSKLKNAFLTLAVLIGGSQHAAGVPVRGAEAVNEIQAEASEILADVERSVMCSLSVNATTGFRFKRMVDIEVLATSLDAAAKKALATTGAYREVGTKRIFGTIQNEIVQINQVNCKLQKQ